jgi:hypothetical protein
MFKKYTLLAIGAALLLSLFVVDGSYAFQIINRKPPVDFMTVAEMNGWTNGPQWGLKPSLMLSSLSSGLSGSSGRSGSSCIWLTRLTE